MIKNNQTQNHDLLIQKLTPKEAATLIGCSEYTIKEMARQGKIPSYRSGNRIKFTYEGLGAWIRYQEEQSWKR